jgi:histone chaperone ASF1
VGVNKFVLQADAPDPSQLAQEDLLGVTVVLVTCSYREREFVRVGYYVNNEYVNPDAPPPPPPPTDGSEPPPPPPIPNPVPLEHIQRQILADKPRVTKFPISWGDEATSADTAQQNNNSMMAPPNNGGPAMGMMTSSLPSASAQVTPPGGMSSSHQQQSAGVVFMQEESNMDHSHFGVQAMNE